MGDLLKKAKNFYAAVLSDPAAAADEYLAEGFVLENPLPDVIPFGGTYSGKAGLLRYLGKINEALDMGPLEFDEWLADGNGVVARGREVSRVRATGRSYDMRFVHWLSFDASGRLTAMREFNDTAEMVRAFAE